jgi:hypothetical protein
MPFTFPERLLETPSPDASAHHSSASGSGFPVNLNTPLPDGHFALPSSPQIEGFFVSLNILTKQADIGQTSASKNEGILNSIYSNIETQENNLNDEYRYERSIDNKEDYNKFIQANIDYLEGKRQLQTFNALLEKLDITSFTSANSYHQDMLDQLQNSQGTLLPDTIAETRQHHLDLIKHNNIVVQEYNKKLLKYRDSILPISEFTEQIQSASAKIQQLINNIKSLSSPDGKMPPLRIAQEAASLSLNLAQRMNDYADSAEQKNAWFPQERESWDVEAMRFNAGKLEN